MYFWVAPHLYLEGRGSFRGVAMLSCFRGVSCLEKSCIFGFRFIFIRMALAVLEVSLSRRVVVVLFV